MEVIERIMELSGQGFCCSQILLQLGMDITGESNPMLLRAMGGLCGGVGYSGDVCGTLTGGCCLIAYFAGKGDAEEEADEEYADMLKELCDWFDEQYSEAYGSRKCNDIIEGDPFNKPKRCPGLMENVYVKAVEILQSHGII